jgi:hypothetical protein
MLQDDGGSQDATSTPKCTTIPGVSHVSSGTATGVAMMTARTISRDEILRSHERKSEYAMEPEPEAEPQIDVPRE